MKKDYPIHLLGVSYFAIKGLTPDEIASRVGLEKRTTASCKEAYSFIWPEDIFEKNPEEIKSL